MTDLATYPTTRVPKPEGDAERASREQPTRGGTAEADRLPLAARHFQITDPQLWLDLCA